MRDFSYVELAALQLFRELTDREGIYVVIDTGPYEDDPYYLVRSVVPARDIENATAVLFCDPAVRFSAEDGKRVPFKAAAPSIRDFGPSEHGRMMALIATIAAATSDEPKDRAALGALAHAYVDCLMGRFPNTVWEAGVQQIGRLLNSKVEELAEVPSGPHVIAEGPNKCDWCGKLDAGIMGCPSGDEICWECFEAEGPPFGRSNKAKRWEGDEGGDSVIPEQEAGDAS